MSLDNSDSTTIRKLTSWASFLALESSNLGLYQGRTDLNKFAINAVHVSYRPNFDCLALSGPFEFLSDLGVKLKL